MEIENIARLLLFASKLRSRGTISHNGYISLKCLVVNKDERVLRLLSNEITPEAHILEVVNELIIDEAERVHGNIFAVCPLAHAK
jgi:hypothetical protein